MEVEARFAVLRTLELGEVLPLGTPDLRRGLADGLMIGDAVSQLVAMERSSWGVRVVE